MKSLREKINVSNMRIMLQDLGRYIPSDNEQSKFKNYSKEMLRTGSVIRMYTKAEHGKGRLKAMGSHLGGFSEGIKIQLARGLYHDIDIVNCHPVLLLNLCKQKKWTHDNLLYYIKNREQVLADVIKCAVCTRKDAKTLFLRLMYGGKVNTWKKDIDKPDSKLPVFIYQFKQELDTIAKLVDTTYPEFPKSEDAYNPVYSKMSMFLQDMEHTVLMVIDEFFDDHGYEPGVYMFDGLMVYRKNDEPINKELLTECAQKIKIQTGWNVELEEKEI